MHGIIQFCMVELVAVVEAYEAVPVGRTGVRLHLKPQASSSWEEVESKTIAVDHSSVHVLTKKIA